MAEQILEAMQDSGLHDRVGGGFHRYSVDARWRLPHFEKMLYDNAQLITAYIRHGRADFRTTAINAGDYLLRDLHIGDAFAAAEDADDPEGEGSFYAWSPAQLQATLGADAGAFIADAWHITAGIRHEGHHGPEPVLSHIPHPRGAVSIGDRAAWEQFLPTLRAARNARPRPSRDDKLLTDLNALALEAFSWLARRTGEARFHDAVVGLTRFLRSRHTAAGLLRTTERPAYITDYGATVCGLVAAFNLLGDPALIDLAAAVGNEAVERLRGDNGGFYTTPDGRADLIRRTQEHGDNAWPGGEAQLALGFAQLWAITGEHRWRELAEGILAAAADTITRAPASSVTMLRAWRLLRDGPHLAVVVGDDAALLAAVRQHPDPHLFIVPLARCGEREWTVLEGRHELREAQVLLCRGTSCLAPGRTTEEVAQRLGQLT
jgi:hypothetical protein